MGVRAGAYRRLSAKELMLLNCSAGDTWTARRSNQPILKEISPEYSLEGLKLKLQYFGHLMRKVDSMEKTLMLRQKEKGVAEDEMFRQHRRLNGHESEQTPGDSGEQRSLECCSPLGRKELDTS